MSNIYCGSRTPPKGKRLGSMKECVEKGQISYYGIKKIDSRMMHKLLNSKATREMSASKLTEERGKYRAKVRKINKQLEVEKSSKKKKELRNEEKII